MNSWKARSSGTITANEFTAAEAEFRSSSGSIKLEDSVVPGTLYGTSSSGSINLTAATISDDWTLRSSSGSWNLNVAGQPDNHLNAQLGSGGPVLSVTTSSGRFALR